MTAATTNTIAANKPQENLRNIIKEEYKKCFQDPVYFIKKFVKIQTQDQGIVPFELFDFQEKMIQSLKDHNRVIILKSRQMGISTLVATYILWVMTFNEGKNILIISIKETTAKEIITKIKLANDELPSWLKSITVENNKCSLKLKNQSKVLATSSASDSSRSFSASMIIFDEAAHILEIDELWASAQPTLSTVNEGKAIILSTPKGIGNFFHKTWVEAKNKKNDFFPIELPWNLRPDRDEHWKNQQIQELGARMFGQEMGCDFLSSGTNLIDLSILKEYEEHTILNKPEMGIKDPIEFRYGQTLWIFDKPEDKDYIIEADTARGDGSDYSAAHVLDLETLTQVAEFQAKVGTKEYGDILVTLAMEYNDALLAVERTGGLGWATLQQIINRQYKNTLYSSSDLKIVNVYRQLTNKYNRDDKKLLEGFETTTSTRPLIISKLEAYFRERSVNIRSVRTINELKTFIWDKGKPQAAENYNDDLVMSLGMALWIRDTALRLRGDGITLTKTMLERIHINQDDNKTPIYTSKMSSTGQSQWSMRTGGKPNDMESLTWLLR